MDTSYFGFREAISHDRLTGLWRIMTGYRWSYFIATLTLGLAAGSKTATYLLLKYLIDNVLEQRLFGQLPLVALGFVGLAVFEGSFTFLSGRFAAYTAEGIILRLRVYLFDHIQKLSFTFHDQTSTGELIQRATSDVDAIRNFFAQQAIGVGRILLLFSINLVAILILNWQLALISIIVIPFLVLLSYFFFQKISKVYEAYQEQEAILSTTLQENLAGVRVVKAFARQDYERERFEKENWKKFQRGRFLIQMHAMYWPLSDLLAGFQTLGGFLIGAWMAINGTISVGTYLSYAGLVVWIIWPMRNLGRLIVQTSTAMVSYGRVSEILLEDPEPLVHGSHDLPQKMEGKIVFKNVSFEYEGGIPVLQEINFTAEPGQVIALVGSTGSGKTTLVNLLPRFYHYTQGSITLDGVELKTYAPHFLRQQIGIVEQEPFLFSRTIYENIAYGVSRSVSMREVEEAARAAAIHDVITTFPKGYDTVVGEKGVTLSGGQKQRLAIARTLLKDPRVLILDDATSAVDSETEAQIRSALERLMKGRTTFIIAHRVQSVMIADRILVLDRGQIVQSGTHRSLINQPGLYRQIYELQARIEDELEKEIARVGF